MMTPAPVRGNHIADVYIFETLYIFWLADPSRRGPTDPKCERPPHCPDRRGRSVFVPPIVRGVARLALAP